MKTRYVILFLTTILVGCASVPRGNAVIDNSSSMRDDEGVIVYFGPRWVISK